VNHPSPLLLTWRGRCVSIRDGFLKFPKLILSFQTDPLPKSCWVDTLLKQSLYLILLVSIVLSGCAVDPSINHKSRYKTRVYIVKRGDSIAKIAKKHNLSAEDIKRKNNLTRNQIFPGQRIFIPGSNLDSYRDRRRTSRYKGSPKKYRSAKRYTPKKRKRGKSRNHKKNIVVPTKAPKIGVKLSWPIKKPVITSRFGIRASGKHDGIDIGVPKGTKIYSAAAGEVIFSGWGPTGYGNIVIIKHSKDVFTVYAHNLKNRAKKGARVKRGAFIATVGRTGRATGYHLHFEVRVKRIAYNPLAYLPKL